MVIRFFIVLFAMLVGVSCTTTPVTHSPQDDLGLQWVKHSAEYKAITLQVYQAATLAMPEFIADQSWSAMPGQEDAQGLRPAVILDVDETVVSGIDFQLAFERPFTNRKLYDYYQDNAAIPVPGVVEFIAAARQAGVVVFFVTNRPCEAIDDDPDPCPQKPAVLEEIHSIGVDADISQVMLSDEQGWDRAKISRREHIAETHRVIMLIGDDLGDFAPCVRTKLYGPCTEPATRESRKLLVEQYSGYWGNGWYILPGPTHGSWTSFTK